MNLDDELNNLRNNPEREIDKATSDSKGKERAEGRQRQVNGPGSGPNPGSGNGGGPNSRQNTNSGPNPNSGPNSSGGNSSSNKNSGPSSGPNIGPTPNSGPNSGPNSSGGQTQGNEAPQPPSSEARGGQSSENEEVYKVLDLILTTIFSKFKLFFMMPYIFFCRYAKDFASENKTGEYRTRDIKPAIISAVLVIAVQFLISFLTKDYSMTKVIPVGIALIFCVSDSDNTRNGNSNTDRTQNSGGNQRNRNTRNNDNARNNDNYDDNELF